MICWWCSGPLIQAVTKKPLDGVRIVLPWTEEKHEVRVHKTCEREAREYVRRITASPPNQDDHGKSI